MLSLHGIVSDSFPDAVTPQQLNSFKLYAQWSAAAGCNSEKPAGQPVTCKLDQCSMFDSHNATVVASFMYVSLQPKASMIVADQSNSGTVLDTRGFVGIDPVDKQIVVSFRGSASVRNWIAK